MSLASVLWIARPDHPPLAALALLGYGATIVSFLGALHWGAVMREAPPQPATSLLWGVVPSLLAWLALLLGDVPGLLLIAALLWACYAADRMLFPRYQFQGWLPMRLQLTLVASLSCLASAWSLM